MKRRGASPSGIYRRIWDVVARIPKGRVATYGQVAALAGFPRHARLAGYALHALPLASRVPWHRVVNAKGECSPRRDGSGHEHLQRVLLRKEGIRLDRAGRLDLPKVRWRP